MKDHIPITCNNTSTMASRLIDSPHKFSHILIFFWKILIILTIFLTFDVFYCLLYKNNYKHNSHAFLFTLNNFYHFFLLVLHFFKTLSLSNNILHIFNYKYKFGNIYTIFLTDVEHFHASIIFQQNNFL